MNIESLQSAIDVLFNPSGVLPQVKEQAQEYCNQFALSNSAYLSDFFAQFVSSENDSMRYWLLQAIVDIINNTYS